MKYLLMLTLSLFIFNNNKTLSDVMPNDIFTAIEVVELQMTSLQTNSEMNNAGIYQCWLFAHPENKKYTGPFSNFKRMIKDTTYKILLNSKKFKTKLISKSNEVVKYSVVIDAFDNKRYKLGWVLEKAKLNKDWKNCWMTSAVTQPQFIGQLN